MLPLTFFLVGTFEVVSKMNVYNGPVADLDVKKGIIVCSGFSKRGNDNFSTILPDKTIKVAFHSSFL